MVGATRFELPNPYTLEILNSGILRVYGPCATFPTVNIARPIFVPDGDAVLVYIWEFIGIELAHLSIISMKWFSCLDGYYGYFQKTLGLRAERSGT